MSEWNFSRRNLLARSAGLVAFGGLLPFAAKAAGPACVDPDGSDKSLRDSLHYAEASPDKEKVCGICAFFEAGEKPDACGSCKIFNGPANPKGHCDSWSAKS
jgi:hypothetical protein